MRARARGERDPPSTGRSGTGEWWPPLWWICAGCAKPFLFDPPPRCFAARCPACGAENSLRERGAPLVRAFRFRPEEPLPEAVFAAVWERTGGRDVAASLARERLLEGGSAEEVRLLRPNGAVVDTRVQRTFSPILAWMRLTLPSRLERSRLTVLTAKIPRRGDWEALAGGFATGPPPGVAVCWEIGSVREVRHTVRSAYGRLDGGLFREADAAGRATWVDREALRRIGRGVLRDSPFLAARRGGALQVILPWGLEAKTAGAILALCRRRFPEARSIERAAGYPPFIEAALAYGL